MTISSDEYNYLSPFFPLLDSWIDEKTVLDVRKDRISVLTTGAPDKKPDFHSIRKIARLIKNFQVPSEKLRLSPLELIKLRSALLELSKRITSHNKFVEGSLSHRILDFFLRFLGYAGLKYEPVETKVIQQLNKHILDKREELIATLIQNPEHFSNDSRLCDVIEKITQNKTKVSSGVFHKALTKTRSLAPYTTPETSNLDLFTAFKVALFIESNREAMKSFGVGKKAKSREDLGIGRITLRDSSPPLIIEYAPARQEIFIFGKQFTPGSFKTGRCVIDYENARPLALLNASHNPKKSLSPQRFEVLTEREFELMYSLEHEPHVVKLIHSARYHSFKKAKTVFRCLMPFYSEGDLFKVIKRGGLSTKDKLTLARDILLGVIELHKNQILHLDIKPENIFVDRNQDAQGNLVYHALVGDLGLSLKKEATIELAQHQHGSPSFFPLEILEVSAIQSETSDLWALGLTLYHLYAGTPFIEEHESKNELISTLKKLSNEPAKHAEDPVLDAILGLLRPVASERSRPELVLKAVEAQLLAV